MNDLMIFRALGKWAFLGLPFLYEDWSKGRMAEKDIVCYRRPGQI